MLPDLPSLVPSTRRRRTLAVYLAMTLGAVAIFSAIRTRGELLSAPVALAAEAQRPSSHAAELAHVLLALAVITLLVG